MTKPLKKEKYLKGAIFLFICFFIWSVVAVYRFLCDNNEAWLCAACAVAFLVYGIKNVRTYKKIKDKK